MLLMNESALYVKFDFWQKKYKRSAVFVGFVFEEVTPDSKIPKYSQPHLNFQHKISLKTNNHYKTQKNS